MSAAALENFDRLCVHTITTRPWSIEEILQRYPAAGVKGISVWRYSLEKRDPARIGAQIRQAGMSLVSLVRGGFFCAPGASERQQALDTNRQAIRTSLAQIQAGLEAILPYAESCGVRLAVEPLHPMYADSRSAVATLKTANDLVEGFGSPWLGVAVDVFHVWWDPDLEEQIRRSGRQGTLFAFHLCDWKTGMEDMLNDRGLMGEGIIRLREIRGWVEEAGFAGFNEVEIFSQRWWERDQGEFLEQIKQAYRRCA